MWLDKQPHFFYIKVISGDIIMNNEEQEKVQVQAENDTAETSTGNIADNAEKPSETWEEADEVKEETATESEVEVSAEAVLKAEVAALKDQLLRKEADYQNYRKRMAREVSDARRIGLVETIMPFLQVFDLFEMAMKAAETSDNVAALKQGLEMILAQYGKTIDELGVQKFDTIGESFDPMWHDAVAYENSETAAEGIIIKQWNCGYKMGDRLLRPARVIVSSGRAEAAAEESAGDTANVEKADDGQ